MWSGTGTDTETEAESDWQPYVQDNESTEDDETDDDLSYETAEKDIRYVSKETN